MGRSAIDYLSQIMAQNVFFENVLLIGSKPSQIVINAKTFKILEPSSAFNQIKDQSIFLNAAFLRREFLQSMSEAEFVKKNIQISDFAIRALQRKRLKSFINLSSGVAGRFTSDLSSSLDDPYSVIKRSLENQYSDSCDKHGAAFINCRIYSLSGKHINEFRNLALTSIIMQAIAGDQIRVKSPATQRTYLDSIDLAKILLTMGTECRYGHYDSGGTLVTLLDLAQTILTTVGGNNIEILAGDEKSPDYFGDYETFNSLALDMNIKLKSLEEQIVETIKAFN